jgi:DNA-binding XRE family transcriptional regulator
MPAKSKAVASAIKKLRDDLDLTQVQLANSLGITPTSIYRYEAEASTPDAATAAMLWNFALQNGSSSAIDFSEMLANMIEPLRPFLEAASADQEKLLQSTGIQLKPDDRILVMALIKMLQGPAPDQTITKVLSLLLEPWKEQAKAEFAVQLGDSLSPQPQTERTKRISRDPTANDTPRVRKTHIGDSFGQEGETTRKRPRKR